MTTALANATLPLALLVNTTNGDTTKPGYVLLSANMKDKIDPKTKKLVPVPDELRYRNVWIPELSIPSVEDRFKPALLVKFYELAKSQFTATMQDRHVVTVRADDYTIDGLLRYFDLDSVSGRLTIEGMAEWFRTTATFALMTDYGKQATWLDTIGKFAAGNHSNNATTCRAVLAKMVSSDLDSPIGRVIADKCAKRIEETERNIDL